MDPILNLKRDREDDFEQCIICQDDKHEKLLNASEQGLVKLKESASIRHKLRDVKNNDVIDRIATIADDTSLVWHKSCYSSFTSKNKISRLEKSNYAEVTCTNTGVCNTSTEDQNASSRNLRSSMQPIDWNLCMFCQMTSRTKLSAVTTLKMSQQILDASKYDQVLSVQLSSVHDLIASEGKYHCTCYKAFIRKTSKTAGSITKCDLAIQWLIEELKNSADQGHILELSEVWNRYCELAELAGTEVPHSFVSRRATFKEKLQSQLEVYDFVIMCNQAILVPTDFRHIPITRLLDETDDQSTMQVYKPGNSEFLELVHVALKLRSDILAQPRHKGLDVSEDAVMACIPDSLYMFIRLVIGGQNDSDTELEESGDEQCNKSRIQKITFSLAQDLVYNATGGKNWTPKHIGLASTLHQTTRSKELVQLFHNAGHTVSYENVLQLKQFVEERLLSSGEKKFRDPLHKNKPRTFSSLFEPHKISRTEKEKVMRADRLVLQRLISAYEAGRSIDLDEILKHELLPVPVALAEMNGTLRTGSKAVLLQGITSGISCPSSLSNIVMQNASLIIDGQALVVAIGKPPGLVTFGDFANTFVEAVLKAGANFNRIDVVFDRLQSIHQKRNSNKTLSRYESH